MDDAEVLHDARRRSRSARRTKHKSIDKTALRLLAPYLRRFRRTDSPPSKMRGLGAAQKQAIRTKIKELIAKLTSFCKDSLELPAVVRDTAEILKEVTKSDGVSSYIVEDSGDYIRLIPKYMPQNGRHTVRYKVEPGSTVAAYVAHTQEYVIVDDILGDSRFPKGIPGGGRCIKSVICIPVLTSAEGDCTAVIEMYRKPDQNPYTTLDLQICVSMTGWMGAAIHQNNEKLYLLKSTELSNYLASLVEYFFAGSITFTKFVSDIIECSKLSVQAERGTLYVLDAEVTEGLDEDIMADVYEEGLDPSHNALKKRNKQRFSKNSPCFVVHVARRGKLVNVSEVYDDPRFNKASDLYGHLTRSLISIPLKGSLGVLGVLQLVNKQGAAHFTKHDELLLQKIASYAFLACQHDALKEQLHKYAYKFKGYEELLKIHMSPCADELFNYKCTKMYEKADMPENFFGFEWIITGSEVHASRYTIFMFNYLLGDTYFDCPTLINFVLTVKKSYRDNPYHNFIHAFTVCHCMFNLLHRNYSSFTTLEILTLMVATICHDSDHFGYTNNFLEMTKHWLAELYWVSPLEHHHFNVCLLMLESTQLFARLTPNEVAESKRMLKALILSTDLVNIFRTRNHLISLIKTRTFDWDNYDHKMLFLGMVMTICDVSGQCKPFYAAKKVTEGLYREFYNQGDVEKQLGFTPLTMMDREKIGSIPESQIQFLTLICLPSIEILVMIFPNTHDLLFHCAELKECWSYIQEKKVVEVWKMEDCILDRIRKKSSRKLTLSVERIQSIGVKFPRISLWRLSSWFLQITALATALVQKSTAVNKTINSIGCFSTHNLSRASTIKLIHSQSILQTRLKNKRFDSFVTQFKLIGKKDKTYQ